MATNSPGEADARCKILHEGREGDAPETASRGSEGEGEWPSAVEVGADDADAGHEEQS
jgi:hypothetical protein